MEVYVAKVLNGKAAAKEYGINEKAKYVVAPSGKLFRGFTQNILEVIAFGGVRFFSIAIDIAGVCEVHEDIFKGALAGDETLAAVQKKLTAYFSPPPQPEAKAIDNGVKSDATGDDLKAADNSAKSAKHGK